MLLQQVKLNENIGPLLEAINSRVQEQVQFFICLGARNVSVINIIDKIHFDPYINNYTLLYNDESAYNTIIRTCDLILCPFPYSSYISLIDAFSARVPAVTMYRSEYYASCCAAKILELVGVDDTIAHSREDYVSKAVQLIDDAEYRKTIVDKLNSTEFDQIIAEHNTILKNEFKDWFISLM